ncbi:FkbM family methyltransferase [Microvirga aerilata]|uniref:FkbM family methyltransferase n=1 Tax=Microvirga aerilata TaxID=670292 RepID=A0A937D0J5_9HYPH|nr:FkbM family methyltransferase [Microvirga aerilata]MBL0407804.1 FkbM family methyltransferase [Microvirga aerilata]
MQLIYDVGVHDGTDTAYYLRCGYKVIGIEANPEICSDLNSKFLTEIKDGRLKILNIGIAATQGTMDFWICDSNSEWSSFKRETASRNGSRHHSIPIQCTTLAEVINTHGVPFYCKIDIEGNDGIALNSLSSVKKLPEYISVEMSYSRGGNYIQNLLELGYNRFKIIDQQSRSQPFLPVDYLKAMLPRPAPRIIRRMDTAFRGVDRDGDWRFSHGSSGPFAEKTPGNWKTAKQVLVDWKRLQNINERFKRRGLGDWYDIHAAQ